MQYLIIRSNNDHHFEPRVANKALEAKVSEGEEAKNRLEAELREKIKKMEKEVENATVKAAGKHCCNITFTNIFTRTPCHFGTIQTPS